MIRSNPSRLLLAAAMTLLVTACSSPSATTAALPSIPPEASASPTPAPTHPGPTYPPGCPTSQPAALATDATRTVTITTDKGDIVIKVEGRLSPIATGNFVALASCGYYNSVVFHRVVPNFVIQGGDGQFGRSPDVITDLVGAGGPRYTIKDEKVTATYRRGVVAMARTIAPDSVRSQFFIVVGDAATPALAKANTYQIIGEVTSGMDVVDAIVKAANGKEQPDDPVVMTKVTVATP